MSQAPEVPSGRPDALAGSKYQRVGRAFSWAGAANRGSDGPEKRCRDRVVAPSGQGAERGWGASLGDGGVDPAQHPASYPVLWATLVPDR
jgi:hypothetical protein